MLQSGEVDIDFDRIFTHPRIRLTCNREESRSFPAGPAASQVAGRQGVTQAAGRQPVRQAGNQTTSQAGRKPGKQASGQANKQQEHARRQPGSKEDGSLRQRVT